MQEVDHLGFIRTDAIASGNVGHFLDGESMQIYPDETCSHGSYYRGPEEVPGFSVSREDSKKGRASPASFDTKSIILHMDEMEELSSPSRFVVKDSEGLGVSEWRDDADAELYKECLSDLDVCIGDSVNGSDYVDPKRLTQVLRRFQNDNLCFLCKSPEYAAVSDEVFLENKFLDSLDLLRQQLYLATIAKDIAYVLLSGQGEADQKQQCACNEVFKLQMFIQGTQGIDENSVGENCRSVLMDIVAQMSEKEAQCLLEELSIQKLDTQACEHQNKEENSEEMVSQLFLEKEILQEKFLNANAKIDELIAQTCSLQSQLEKAEKEKGQLLVELSDSRTSEKVYLMENANLTDNIISISKEKITIELEKEYVYCANENLKAELCDYKEHLSILPNKQSKLETDLKETMAALEYQTKENASLIDNVASLLEEMQKFEREKIHLVSVNEKLSASFCEHTARFNKESQQDSDLTEIMATLEYMTGENIYLSHSLDIYAVKLSEFHDQYQQFQFHSNGVSYQMENYDGLHDVCYKKASISPFHGKQCKNERDTCSVLEPTELGSAGGSLFEEAYYDCEEIMIVRSHLEDALVILQQLESAVKELHASGKIGTSGVSKLIRAFEMKAHHDETVSVGGSSIEGETLDTFKLALAQTSNLRERLRQLELTLDKVCDGFRQEKKHRELIAIAARKLELQCKIEKDQNHELHSKNNELVKKLSAYLMRIDELLNHIVKLQHNVDDKIDVTLDQLENLHGEVDTKLSKLDHERDSSLSLTTFDAAHKLRSSIQHMVFPCLPSVDDLDFGSFLAATIDDSMKAIEHLHTKLEAAYLDQERLLNAYIVLDQSVTDINGKKDLAVQLLNKIHGRLKVIIINSHEEIEEAEIVIKAEESLDVVLTKIEMLFHHLQKLVDQKEHHLCWKSEVMSELTRKDQVIKDLEDSYVHLSLKLEEAEMKNSYEVIKKVVADIARILQFDDRTVLVGTPQMQLEVVVEFFLKKYKDTVQQLNLISDCLKEFTKRELCSDYCAKQLHELLREEFDYWFVELNELQEKVDLLSVSHIQMEVEICFLREGLGKMNEILVVAHSNFQNKASELEQVEQRLSSAKEKLNKAVMKGKGLILQKDSLKQSLAEKCCKVESCLQELQAKDAKLLEMEARLKFFSESGDRIEALESELSYIRNSATALRESFLLKDSLLQRIEEILQDLEFPEHVRPRDIIDKVEWLAVLAAGSFVPLVGSNQKSATGASYSNAGFLVMGNWENQQQNLVHPGSDDLRRKYDELESKFHGLAEHNEMLEQSLLERNNLVHRWEEIVDQVDVPVQLQSSDTDNQLEWLIRAFREAQHESDSSLQRIKNLERLLKSQMVELENVHDKLSNVGAMLVVVVCEKELIFENMMELTDDYDKLLDRETKFDLIRNSLQEEVIFLKEQLAANSEKYCHVEHEMWQLWSLVSDALPERGISKPVTSVDTIIHLKELLRKHFAHCRSCTFCYWPSCEKEKECNLDNAKDINEQECNPDANDIVVSTLDEKFAATSCSLTLAEEERDRALGRYQSAVAEAELITKQSDKLHQLLFQEQQKSASLREKLNVAVRKGKGLVLQRDGLKETVLHMNNEMDKLRLQLDKKTSDCNAFSEKIIALECETSLLRNRLEEADEEAKKSKGAAEVLSCELNEIHQKTKHLHEEMTKAESIIQKLSEKKDMAEAARFEVLSNIEKLNNKYNANLQELKTTVVHLSDDWSACVHTLVSIFSRDSKILCDLEGGLWSVLRMVSSTEEADTYVLDPPHASLMDEGDIPPAASFSQMNMNSGSGMTGISDAIGHGLQECARKIESLKKICSKHLSAVDKQALGLSTVIQTIKKEIVFQKDVVEAFKREKTHFELLLDEKNAEIHILHRSLKLFYESCTNAILEIDNQKILKSGTSSNFLLLREQVACDGLAFSWSEDFVKQVASALIFAVNSIPADVERQHGELKTTILNLQREIHEKDVHTNRICAELVTQIKDAETTANTYLTNLNVMKAQVEGLRKEVEEVRSQKLLAEEKLIMLDNVKAASENLHQRNGVLSETIISKDQEIESLMQALDEEEMQVEGLTIKIKELEKMIEQKNLALENLEASRGKTLMKLPVMLSKFNELHRLSESFLSEIESLQRQSQSQDAEISFLRHEMTRCTRDILALQESGKRSSFEVAETVTWLKAMVSHFGEYDFHFDDEKDGHIHAYMDFVGNKITSLIAELDDLRAVAQSRDVILKTEKEVEKLAHCLEEKESQMVFSHASSPENREVEHTTNKRAFSLGPIAPHARTVHKASSGRVAVDVDLEVGDNSTFDDEDDDKGHDFKSLTMSRIVPRITRPLADKIDGIWVSGGRMLMRQPSLRLGVVVYWVVLHLLLATSVV